MIKYICIAPSKEQFNIKGESLGMSGKRALYYSGVIGKHRIYRSFYPLKPYIFQNKNINKNLKLLYFDTLEEATELCNEINTVYNDDFVVKEVNINEE